jgi:hypothetical protein
MIRYPTTEILVQVLPQMTTASGSRCEVEKSAGVSDFENQNRFGFWPFASCVMPYHMTKLGHQLSKLSEPTWKPSSREQSTSRSST